MDTPEGSCDHSVLRVKIASLEKLLHEKERRIEDKFELMFRSLDERHHTQKEALSEAKRVVDMRLAEMNNLRLQIEGERTTYVTKGEFTVAGIVIVAIGVIVSFLKWAF
jgi:hypothetical protein